MTMTSSAPRRVTVIGAGFGALSVVRELRRRDASLDITLIAPRAELHYLPGIIWIPSGLRTREQLVLPLANFFRRMQVKHVAGEVTGLRRAGVRPYTSPFSFAKPCVFVKQSPPPFLCRSTTSVWTRTGRSSSS